MQPATMLGTPPPPRRAAETTRVPAWVRRAAAGLLALAAAAGDMAAQDTTGVLRGRVFDRATGRPIVGAALVLLGDGRRATTDSAGRFRLGGLPRGTQRFVLRATGFPDAPFETLVRAAGVADADVSIVLDSTTAARAAQALAAVRVSAAPSAPVNYRLVDFERRRRTGRGQYLTSEEIERTRAASLPELTRGMRGVTLHCGGGGGCRIHMVRAPFGCAPEYVVDGRAENMFGAQTPIRDIVALEVYTGAVDVPGEFAGRNAGCGVVVIWTRSGPPRRGDP